jgi:hypothetical protein
MEPKMSDFDSNFPEPIDPKDNQTSPSGEFIPEPAPVFDDIPAAVSDPGTPGELPEPVSINNTTVDTNEPTPLPDDFAEPLPESLASSGPSMQTPPVSDTASVEPKKDNKKTIWIIVAIVAALLIICCCITVAIGIGLFQISEDTSWEFSKVIPLLQYLM